MFRDALATGMCIQNTTSVEGVKCLEDKDSSREATQMVFVHPSNRKKNVITLGYEADPEDAYRANESRVYLAGTCRPSFQPLVRRVIWAPTPISSCSLLFVLLALTTEGD